MTSLAFSHLIPVSRRFAARSKAGKQITTSKLPGYELVKNLNALLFPHSAPTAVAARWPSDKQGHNVHTDTHSRRSREINLATIREIMPWIITGTLTAGQRVLCDDMSDPETSHVLGVRTIAPLFVLRQFIWGLANLNHIFFYVPSKTSWVRFPNKRLHFFRKPGRCYRGVS